MTLSKKKQTFVFLTGIVLVGFTLVKTNFNPPEMEPWPVETDGQYVEPVSTVALYRSDKANAEDIEYDEIKTMITQAIEAVGGLDSIISDGDSVILKPNLVGGGGGRPEVNGKTTDPRVVRIVAEIVRELNPNGWIGVLEGSAPGDNQHTEDMFELYAYTAENLPDVDKIIALEDVCGSHRDYDSPQLVSANLPEGKGLYPDSKKPNESSEIYFAKLFYNADVIISIPVLKNHESAALTCAVKNTSIGMTPTSIYSINTWNIPNLRWEIEHGYPYMHYWLHDFYMARPVDFVIVDGLQCLQYGPGGGSSVSRNRMNMRLIMAGKDLIAVDAIGAYLVGMDANIIDYLVYLHNDQVGCVDHRLIRVKGNVRVSDAKKKFKHDDERTIARMISDFTPPDLSIASFDIDGKTLKLSLNTSEETELVEILINGDKITQNVISNFDDIQIEYASVLVPEDEIEVIAYDQYRNAASVSTVLSDISGPGSQVATTFKLFPNSPNPFNPETVIKFRLPKSSQIILSVFSLNGERIRILEDGTKTVGEHHARWDGTNAQGQPVASGLYIYQLIANSGSERIVQSGKMSLIR